MGCGSTIGLILASGACIRTVDCGIAQLSMHMYYISLRYIFISITLTLHLDLRFVKTKVK